MSLDAFGTRYLCLSLAMPSESIQIIWSRLNFVPVLLIADLGWERYKYVVQVVVGEQRGEGIK
jgi:hypothetical protein